MVDGGANPGGDLSAECKGIGGVGCGDKDRYRSYAAQLRIGGDRRDQAMPEVDCGGNGEGKRLGSWFQLCPQGGQDGPADQTVGGQSRSFWR